MFAKLYLVPVMLYRIQDLEGLVPASIMQQMLKKHIGYVQATKLNIQFFCIIPVPGRESSGYEVYRNCWKGLGTRLGNSKVVLSSHTYLVKY